MDLIEKVNIRRFFRATRKLTVPGLVSHITQRAAGKEPLFIEDADYLYMLLSPTQENLYDAMRDLFSRYAMRFNRKYERKGHLFGGPYRQAVCFDNGYLLAASLYIHLNPVRASIVADPLDYR